jgi:hypothetical protein
MLEFDKVGNYPMMILDKQFLQKAELTSFEMNDAELNLVVVKIKIGVS